MPTTPMTLYPVTPWPLMTPDLEDELDDLGVHQPMDRLPIDVGDEVTGAEPCLLRWAPLLHVLYPQCTITHNAPGP